MGQRDPKIWAKADPSRGLPGIASAFEEDTHTSALTTTRLPPLDRTSKMYIGGKQKRADSAYSIPVFSADGRRAVVGHVGDGNRKDCRDAVAAAHSAAPGW